MDTDIEQGSYINTDRHPGFENLEAAVDHYRRRTLEQEQEIDELRLRNNHLRYLVFEYRRAEAGTP